MVSGWSVGQRAARALAEAARDRAASVGLAEAIAVAHQQAADDRVRADALAEIADRQLADLAAQDPDVRAYLKRQVATAKAARTRALKRDAKAAGQVMAWRAWRHQEHVHARLGASPWR